jgi:hypothetical protein
MHQQHNQKFDWKTKNCLALWGVIIGCKVKEKTIESDKLKIREILKALIREIREIRV